MHSMSKILPRPINLDHLASFIDVITLGSFSAAAERKSLSQPAISLHVRQLEDWIGARLIERVGKRVTPTLAGKELVRQAPHVLRAVDEAVQAVNHTLGADAGRVRIGTGATACIYLLPSILGTLKMRFPKWEVSVTTGNAPDIVRAIEENLLDLALVTMPVGGRALYTEVVSTETLVFVAPKGFESPGRITPSDLARFPILAFEESGNTRRLVDDWSKRSPFSPIMSLGSVEAIKELVKEGLGCAILPGMSIKKSRSQFTVCSLDPPLSRELAIVMRNDRQVTRGMKELMVALRKIQLD
ncbi:LysR family transcriptional regulator [Rhizobium sp. BK008]|uniref:LysR family transcriptional regulator n=1 Tax=Rhizobium sp. BK008 TaxID=2587094 RepID=UPI00183EB2DD|nr:LysR family transcriptional regulator [Rhizobium sp. BK008]MBB4255724.1 DNA-binding transcriptional LysR family regulator [Rhizobium sp. BK008]